MHHDRRLANALLVAALCMFTACGGGSNKPGEGDGCPTDARGDCMTPTSTENPPGASRDLETIQTPREKDDRNNTEDKTRNLYYMKPNPDPGMGAPIPQDQDPVPGESRLTPPRYPGYQFCSSKRPKKGRQGTAPPQPAPAPEEQPKSAAPPDSKGAKDSAEPTNGDTVVDPTGDQPTLREDKKRRKRPRGLTPL